MTNLREEIRGISEEAARELERYTDSEIKLFDRQDLLELFPGNDKLIVRKKIHQVICRLPTPLHEYSIDTILKDVKKLIPPDSFADALTDNGPLLQYLHILKELRAQLMPLQEFIEAQIHLLEKKKENQAEKSNKGSYTVNSVKDAPTPAPDPRASEPKNSLFGRISWPSSWLPTPSLSQERQDEVLHHTNAGAQAQADATVMYKMVVCGNTLDKHLDVIKKVRGPIPGHSFFLDLQETEQDKESQVTIVFCPVVSRMGTDVEAALSGISRDKPVILVVMHHMHTPKSFPVPGPYHNVKLGVNIFFHDTANGLLNCTENHEAITEIKAKLLEYSTKKSCRILHT